MKRQQEIFPGCRVVYADGFYEVVSVNDNLLTLRGIVDLASRTVREGATVLASDVTLIGRQTPMELVAGSGDASA